jgi:glycosyltransferase involved in cell wall biosynthesis
LRAGGAEKQCILLTEVLSKHHNVTLVILNPNEVYKPRLTYLNEHNLAYKFLSKNPLSRAFQLINFFKKDKTDFIFSFLPTDTLLSAICGRIAGVPNIFGGIRSSFLPRIKFLSLKLVNNYLLDYTISNNFAARETAISLGFNSNIFVIPNGIEIREPSLKKSEKTIKIISLGRLVEAKQYGVAIKTIAALQKKIGDTYSVTYSIIGQGPLESSIKEDIKSNHLENKISVTTDASDMYELLDNSDIYLCTSSFEGISNALMEAMNCKLPIVATDVGDNSQLVLDNNSGFLAPVHDYEQLAVKLFELVQSEELRNKMGLEAYTHLSKNFSNISFQQKYLRIISNVKDIKIENGRLVLNSMEPK